MLASPKLILMDQIFSMFMVRLEMTVSIQEQMTISFMLVREMIEFNREMVATLFMAETAMTSLLCRMPRCLKTL